jgi:hypothetical protein
MLDNPLFLADRDVATAQPITRFNSEIYLVTRLDGFTTADAKALVDRSLAAERAGTIVLDQKSTLIDRGGDQWLQTAAERLKSTAVAGQVALENSQKVATATGPVLGYFSDRSHKPLAEFLEGQRIDRRRRVKEMTSRLAALGMPLDIDDILARHAGHAIGRPALAAALVRAGYVATIAEAFDRFLGTEGAAFVQRQGAPVREVVRVIRDAGGLGSIAHPGLHRDPALLLRLASAEHLDAIEVFHTDHDEPTTARLLALADERGLLVTGGSDFHGDASGRAIGLGRIALPADRFARFADRAGTA